MGHRRGGRKENGPAGVPPGRARGIISPRVNRRETTMIATADQTPARPRRRSSAKPQVRDRIKASLLLSADVDMKLSIRARMLGMDRSALANQILAEAVRGVVVS